MSEHNEHSGASGTSDDAHVESLLLELTDEDRQLGSPPPEIWSRIAEQIGATTPSTPVSVDAVSTPEELAATSTVVALDARRRPTMWLGAAAAVALVAAAGVFILNQSDQSTDDLIATSTLNWDPDSFDPIGSDASAAALLVRDEDDALKIDLADATLPTPVGDGEVLEVWLIQPDASNNPAELVSLGLIDEMSAVEGVTSFEVPEGIDTEEYFVVDISVEPDDGDPTHSGRSILRGALERA